MRTLCLVLILANALFFIWAQLVDVRVSPLDRAPIAAAAPPPRIVLAREVEDAGEEAPAPTPDELRRAESEGAQAGRPGPDRTMLARADHLTCTSVGPFPDLPQAADAAAALTRAGYHAEQRVEEGEIWVGYWVSVPDLPTRAAAEAAIRTLIDNGVTDVYLMPETQPGHVVSLGVFSDYQRARRRADQVRALGLEPRINDRKRPGSVYWLDVALREPGERLDASVFQTGEARILRLEMRACPN